MKRRDFLTLRSKGGQQLIMLSCQRLYMTYNNTLSQPQHAASELPANDEDWWTEEPPLSVASTAVERLFTDLARELEQADVLILEDREWLQEREFVKQVERLLAGFRARGGEIRYPIQESVQDSSTDSRKAV